MTMKTYTSLNAKNQFGQLLDDAQQSPVTITKHNRPVGVLLSINKLTAIADSFLSEPLKQRLRVGEVSLVEAIEEQMQMDNHIRTVLADVDAGNYSEADDNFFARIRGQQR